MGRVLSASARGTLDGDVEDVSVLALAYTQVISIKIDSVVVYFLSFGGTYWLRR